jgi:uncharacterized protein
MEATMGDQQNLDVVRGGYEAFGRGDIEGLINRLADDVTWDTPGPSDLPTAGKRRGHDQVRDFFKIVNELFEFEKFDPHTFVAQGDRVVVLGDDALRLKASGEALQESWAHAFTLKDGKIVAFHEYLDTAALVAAMRKAEARA